MNIKDFQSAENDLQKDRPDIMSKTSILFMRMNNEGIHYCHWKSNFRLRDGLAGKTDLDILVDNKDRQKFNIVLDKLGFIKIVSPPAKQYPGMEDFLGLDTETGKFCHLHVHYQLILGQKYFKNYHLPIERFVLNNLRILNNVNVPIPEIELFLLIIRSCMKLGTKSVFQYFLHQKETPFPDDILDEFHFLIRDYNPNKFKQVLINSGLQVSVNRIIDFVEKMKNGVMDLAAVLSMRHYIFCALRPFRLQHPLRSIINRVIALFHLVPVIKRLWPMPKKTLFGYGVSFALVGADGSGKSTLVRDLKKWLSWKLEVKTLYFGIPKKLWLRITDKLIFALRFFYLLDYRKFFLPVVNFAHLISARRWIWIARNRLNLYHQLVVFSNRGGIALADRYPLSSFRNMLNPMDGPRIRNEIGIGSMKWARQEERFYSLIDLPDKVFVLQADVEELRKRKRDLYLSTHKSKANAVNSLKQSDKICLIDANRPYADVLLDIKKEIWNLL